MFLRNLRLTNKKIRVSCGMPATVSAQGCPIDTPAPNDTGHFYCSC